jgi:hypothetical protein
MPPKRKPKAAAANAAAANAAAANAAAANAAAANAAAANAAANAAASNAYVDSSLGSRITGLSIQVPNGNGNLAAVASSQVNNRNAQPQAPAELSVNAPRTGKEEAVNHRAHAAANHNANNNADRNLVSSSTSFLSASAPVAASAAAAASEPVYANHNANRNAAASSSSSVAASEPAAVGLLSHVSEPLKTDDEIDATIIHPHHLELKDDWASIFIHEGLVPYCDVCGRRGMSRTYRCNSMNCLYDECETCYNAEHRRQRQQLPNSILPVFTILSDEQIRSKLSFTPHKHVEDGGMLRELPFREWPPNNIRRCDICGRLALKTYHCDTDGHDECVYCRMIFNRTSTFRIQKERFKRQIENEARRRISQLGHGGRSTRNAHHKKASRRTHKRSARR